MSNEDEQVLLGAPVAQILDDHVDGVYSYCRIMLRSADQARVASRHALTGALTAALGNTPRNAGVRIDEADGTAGLRARIFTHARRHVRQISRDAHSETDDHGSEPALRDLILDELEGFGERDKDLMALSIVEGLDDHAVAVVTGVEESHLPNLLRRMRRRVRSAVGPLLLLQGDQPECPELEAVVAGGGPLSADETKPAVIAHISTCENCQELLGRPSVFDVALATLLAMPAPADLAPSVLEDLEETDIQALAAPTESKTTELGDSAKLVLYGLVALMVGLAGLAVSAQYEPLERPPGLVGASPSPVPPTTTTTDATESPTTTSQATPSSTGSSSGRVVDIVVSDDTIDFGEDGTSGEFDIINEGAQSASFTVESSSEAVALSAGGGELAAGETVTYQVSLDRDQLAEGPLDERIVIAWDGASLGIDVTGVHEDNPVLHNPGASPATVQVDTGRSCSPTQTTVAVRVRDTSRLESVIARWSPDGGGTRETDMIDVGNDIYEAVIGPFTATQTAEVRLVATDEFGNAGGASVTVNVEDCS